MFVITVEPHHRLVRAAFSGLLSVEEVASASRAEQQAVRAQGWEDGGFVELVEALDDMVQPQVVFEALRSLLTDAPRKARKIAIVRPTALTKLQARRGSAMRDGHEVFSDVEEARRWLLDDSAEARV